MSDPCGGCQGLGAHRRWCPEVVGITASQWGLISERLEDLADRIGSNDFTAANHCYVAASIMRRKADVAAEGFRSIAGVPRDGSAAPRWTPPTDPESDPRHRTGY